ncbi:MAG: hypothetical protein H7A41_01360 [Chlamydiales bacterium]|nr:hypothetical protein [Chlamydiia bacterium]MCP5503778.1 hypothetical protein [Chlamydiales bacterium]
MKRSWMLVFFLGVMGFVNAGQHDDQSKPVLYYSDDCDIKITPNAGPRINSDWNVFLTADFIYWTIRQDGMFYAVTGAGANASGGSVHDLSWDWNPGFKVGLGFNLPHDGWDVFAEYTWIQTSPSGSKSQDATNANMIPYWNVTGFSLANGTLVKSKADWDAHYNNVTLDLGRNAYLSQYMKLRLFAGLQAAWINQDYTAQYDLDTGAYGKLKLGQDFWGVGLRAGLNNSFQFTKNFSFFADLYLALLWGKFDLDRRDTVTGVDRVTTETLKTHVKPWTEEPVADIAAGFRYDGWFAEDRFHFLLQAGWEHQLWILHNEVIKATEPDHAGDLLLQGLTVKARLDF